VLFVVLVSASAIGCTSQAGRSDSGSSPTTSATQRQLSDQLARQVPGGTPEQKTIAATRAAKLSDLSTWLDSELLGLSKAGCDVLRRSNGDFSVVVGFNKRPANMSKDDFTAMFAAQYFGVEYLCPEFITTRDAYLKRLEG
jgi:hypothetical protein